MPTERRPEDETPPPVPLEDPEPAGPPAPEDDDEPEDTSA
jgi:hypothetical protein